MAGSTNLVSSWASAALPTATSIVGSAGPAEPTSTIPPPDAPTAPESLSVLPVLFGFLATFVLVALLVNYFGDRRRIRWYVQAVVVISWFLPFTIMFLLPLDLSSTLYRRCEAHAVTVQGSDGRATCPEAPPLVYLGGLAQFIIWRVLYWTMFALTWFTIPFLLAYVDSGAFRTRDRIIAALRANLVYYGIAAVIGGGLLTYISIRQGIADWRTLTAFVMAAANSWGLLLIITFMGCGLVALPRRFWYAADPVYQLRRIETQAVSLKDDWFLAEMDLHDLLALTRAVRDRLPTADRARLRPFVDVILKQFPGTGGTATGATHDDVAVSTSSGSTTTVTTSAGDQFTIPEHVSEQFLVQLHVRVMRARSKEARCRALWEQTLFHALFLQDVVTSARNPHRQLESVVAPYRGDTAPAWRRSAGWWWHLRLRPLLYRVLALACTIWSIMLIWSELTFNVSNPPLSIFARILHASGIGYATLEVVSFVTVAYMCACAYGMLMELNLFHYFALAPNHHTNSRSLLFGGSYLCRLTMPLCYNFLTLSRETVNPVFSQFMGQIDLVPFLGDEFNAWVPTLILIPAILTLGRVHTRLFRLFDPSGADTESPPLASDAEAGEAEGGIIRCEEARGLIDEARRTLERTGSLHGVTGAGGPAARQRNRQDGAAVARPTRVSGTAVAPSSTAARRTRSGRSGSRSHLLNSERRAGTPQYLSENEHSDAELLGTRRQATTGGASTAALPSLADRLARGWRSWLRARPRAGEPESSDDLVDDDSTLGVVGLGRSRHRSAFGQHVSARTSTSSTPLNALDSAARGRSHDRAEPDDEVYDWESGQYIRPSQRLPDPAVGFDHLDRTFTPPPPYQR
ncbi:hypothetical protein IWQ60_009660 [Tieghemiomyces parasiticus]|uniref:LMBR1 domain-containing protein 2 n=1 Tax=Tieghemiomyces parasiticus TaxID=78921 RepID=A0A9W7ZNG3_9FUNG|nr:hypothetical protein IWQ60_009660 [Tieghemiomyces parasiticus]